MPSTAIFPLGERLSLEGLIAFGPGSQNALQTYGFEVKQAVRVDWQFVTVPFVPIGVRMAGGVTFPLGHGF